MYDSTVGRWLSLDPIGFEGNDTNLYRYVGNEPTGFGDSMGLKKEKAIYKTPNEIADALNVRIHYSKDGTSIVKNSWRGGAPDIIVIGSHGYPIKKAKKVIKGCKCPTENHLDEISFDSGPEIFLVNYNAFIYSSFVHELIAGPLAYAVTGKMKNTLFFVAKAFRMMTIGMLSQLIMSWAHILVIVTFHDDNFRNLLITLVVKCKRKVDSRVQNFCHLVSTFGLHLRG